tara:strand:- start:97 stop:606 length:510 start_codon:yes stop_codon:yes gene_type:complete
MNIENASDLKDIVNKVFDLDIMTRTRQREYVDARMTFCYIILKEGGTLTTIGRYMNMNHASVHYYRKRFPWILKSDSTLRDKYKQILSMYNPTPETPEVYLYSNARLIQEVLSLRIEVDDLVSQKDRLLSERSQDKRLASLYKIVKERTPQGQEEAIAHRMSQFYNGQG